MNSMHVIFQFTVVVLTNSHLVSCATSSALTSRTRHVGSVHTIKECRSDAQRAYIDWQVEKDSPTETSVVELDTRNAIHGGRIPASARAVLIAELSGEKAVPSKGHPLPCLGIWRVHPDHPDGPFAPRVRWISRERDFCINLPAKAAEPGRIASRLPMALAQDVLFLGAIIPFSAITSAAGGGPISPSVDAWERGEEEPAGKATKWGVE